MLEIKNGLERSEYSYDIIIVGGGMAGSMAAVAAAEVFEKNGRAGRIMILDAADKPLKKIYATGNGRCNLTNLHFEPDCYYSDSGAPFDYMDENLPGQIMDFFTRAGVLLHERNGYVYPRTDQASDVAAGIMRLLNRHGVEYRSSARVCGIEVNGEDFSKERFLVSVREDPSKRDHVTKNPGSARESVLHAGAVILACGGMVNGIYGCRGDGFSIAEKLGIRVMPCMPALTGLTVDEPLLKLMHGVRCQAGIDLVKESSGSDTGASKARSLGRQRGELQITEQGLSGIPVFQLSRLSGKQNCRVIVDFLPELSAQDYETVIAERLAARMPEDTVADLFSGLVHPKIGSFAARHFGLADEKKIRKIQAPGEYPDTEAFLAGILRQLKCWSFDVTGTFGFSHAQVTAGGIALCEADENLMSVRVPGLYFAGEILDVDGICGGYNLSFAFRSGRIAGAAAAAGIGDTI